MATAAAAASGATLGSTIRDETSFLRKHDLISPQGLPLISRVQISISGASAISARDGQEELAMCALIRSSLFACATGATLLTGLTVSEAQFATPEAAVQAVYAQYEGSRKSPKLLSLQLDKSTANHFFEKEIAAAWLRDLAKAANGDNTIDVDPFTESQDPTIANLVISPATMTGDYAVTQARFRNARKAVRITYRLKRAPDGWRIYDVRSDRGQGLRRALGLRDRTG
ncbi:DUF3828 domain-containing protein [Methylobacterium sp. CB376]|uniref:DUF3828 domain-containing protein n=1 Tax=unclassified Methylobacterium TaxID=2615210 RepID=UPI00223EC2E4|nr:MULTISPECIES: DUF3828 domain-containing protein [Methylobacterium]WFT81303.1 DUF3828 domain-containing protein [Methylobacterium nodulans]